MNVLVSGANGFIGSHLVEALLERGYNVICLVRKTSNLKWIRGLDTGIIFCESIVQKSLFDIIKGLKIDFVFHLAGLVRACNINHYYRVNYLGTKNLVRACKEINPPIKKFVYLSTLETCIPSDGGSLISETTRPEPISDYGKSKLKGEEEVLRYKDSMPVVIIRPAGVFGPRDKDFLFFFQFAKRGILPLVEKGEKFFSLCFVEDLVKCMIDAAESPKTSGKVYFVSDGNVYSWVDFADTITEIMGVKARKINISDRMFLYIATLMEFISRLRGVPHTFDRQKAIILSKKYLTCDTKRIKRDISFSPQYTLGTGLKKTVDWYKSQGWL